jgi:outer membrane protein assembly factor BamC
MRILFTFFIALLLAACSSTDEKILNYRTSEITPTLEIPPDLTQVSAESNLNIPGSKVGLPENRGRYVETGNLNVEVRTLPKVEGLSIEGHGDSHWLKVSDKAEAVYPLLRTFWAEQGFTLMKDEPAVGVMETEWLSAKSGSAGSFISSLLESMKGAEFKDQYQTRIERADDGNSLVFLAHRGQELFIQDQTKKTFNQTGRGSGWQMVPSDPTKEYEMLSRLMLFLGMQDDQVKQEMEKIGLFTPLTRIEFNEADGLTYLVVAQSFEQSWNRLQLQLDRLNIPVLERDKGASDGQIKVSVADLLPADSKVKDDKSDEKVFLVLESGSSASQTRLDVKSESGTILKSGQSRDVLQLLQGLLK